MAQHGVRYFVQNDKSRKICTVLSNNTISSYGSVSFRFPKWGGRIITEGRVLQCITYSAVIPMLIGQ